MEANHNFESKFFADNRARLRSLFKGSAPIIITANGLSQKTTDENYPFQQDSSFWYLTGISEPNLILVIEKNKEYIIIPELSASKEYFDGAIDIDTILQVSGIKDIVKSTEGWRRLNSKIKKVTSVATLSPPNEYIDALGMYTHPARRKLIEKLKAINNDLEFLDLRQHIARMRMIKQPEEIDALRDAINITGKSLKKIYTKYQRGGYNNELEIELDLTRYFHDYGGNGHAFNPIIAAGSKACQIHPTGNTNPINNQNLLVDVGAKSSMYCADISRTWSINPTNRFNDVYDSVKEVSDYAMSILKPGVLVKNYEKAVEHYMGEKLRSLGLINTVESGEIRKYFPHATSHYLGIDTHDVGDYELPLAEGCVLTVEPGIYIAEEGIGVRIENDVLIQDNGLVNLSDKLA